MFEAIRDREYNAEKKLIHWFVLCLTFGQFVRQKVKASKTELSDKSKTILKQL